VKCPRVWYESHSACVASCICYRLCCSDLFGHSRFFWVHYFPPISILPSFSSLLPHKVWQVKSCALSPCLEVSRHFPCSFVHSVFGAASKSPFILFCIASTFCVFDFLLSLTSLLFPTSSHLSLSLSLSFSCPPFTSVYLSLSQ
jgi:hypothetical protein